MRLSQVHPTHEEDLENSTFKISRLYLLLGQYCHGPSPLLLAWKTVIAPLSSASLPEVIPAPYCLVARMHLSVARILPCSRLKIFQWLSFSSHTQGPLSRPTLLYFHGQCHFFLKKELYKIFNLLIFWGNLTHHHCIPMEPLIL